MVKVTLLSSCVLLFVGLLPAQEGPDDRFGKMDAERRNVLQQEATDEEKKAWTPVAEAILIEQKAKAALNYLEKFPEGVYAPFAHEIMAVHARQNNQLNMFFEHGEKAVAGFPDDVALRSSLAAAYADRQTPDPAAIEHGEKALELLAAMERPAEFSEERWPAQKASMMADAHYGAGTAYLFKAFNTKDGKLLQKALDHLEEAVKLGPGQERNHFRLGFAYQISGEVDKAIPSFARAVALDQINAATARQYLEQAYRAAHANLNGLDDLIRKEKEALEKSLRED